MQTIAAGVFKTKCLAIMDQVQASHEPVLITKNGKPVARLVPVEQQQDSILGFYAGKVQIHGDGEVDTPALPLTEWNRLQAPRLPKPRLQGPRQPRV
jgi:prevent-host-death family protein